MHSKVPEIPEGEWEPHFLYKIGQGFAPSKEVKTGTIYHILMVESGACSTPYLLLTLYQMPEIKQKEDSSYLVVKYES